MFPDIKNLISDFNEQHSCGGDFKPEKVARPFQQSVVVSMPTDSYSVMIIKPDGGATLYFTDQKGWWQ
jgi:hypothetical protein